MVDLIGLAIQAVKWVAAVVLLSAIIASIAWFVGIVPVAASVVSKLNLVIPGADVRIALEMLDDHSIGGLHIMDRLDGYITACLGLAVAIAGWRIGRHFI